MTYSTSTRKRGRGKTAAARKASRAAFKAADTRKKNALAAARTAIAKKAWATRRRMAAVG